MDLLEAYARTSTDLARRAGYLVAMLARQRGVLEYNLSSFIPRVVSLLTDPTVQPSIQNSCLALLAKIVEPPMTVSAPCCLVQYAPLVPELLFFRPGDDDQSRGGTRRVNAMALLQVHVYVRRMCMWGWWGWMHAYFCECGCGTALLLRTGLH